MNINFGVEFSQSEDGPQEEEGELHQDPVENYGLHHQHPHPLQAHGDEAKPRLEYESRKVCHRLDSHR